jgi:hypothetical protein
LHFTTTAVRLYQSVMYSAALLDPWSANVDFVMLPANIYIATLSLVALAQCHSYVVEARRVVQGTFVGAPGYPRAYGMVQTPRIPR